jgi:heme exporter protein B
MSIGHFQIDSHKSLLSRWLFTVTFVMQFSFRSVLIRKSQVLGIFVFSICLLILFPFAFGAEFILQSEVRHGAFWSIQEFVAALVVSRMFDAENESGALEFLLASRSPRSAILFGKTLFNALQMSFLQIPLVFFWIIFYKVPSENILQNIRFFIPVCMLFHLSCASLGSLLCCAVARSQAKEILLPLLFFPLQISVLLASVTLMLKNDIGQQMVGGFGDAAWWTLLGGFPVVFFTVGFILDNALFQE